MKETVARAKRYLITLFRKSALFNEVNGISLEIKLKFFDKRACIKTIKSNTSIKNKFP